MSRAKESPGSKEVASPEERTCPGSFGETPNIISADDESGPSRQMERRPRRTKGRSSIQPWSARRAIRADFNWRCIRSTSPFDCGWYEVVVEDAIPKVFMRSFHAEPVNCAPRSVTTSSGIPKRETQPRRKERQQETAEMSLRGNASGHLLKRSTTVRRYL